MNHNTNLKMSDNTGINMNPRLVLVLSSESIEVLIMSGLADMLENIDR